LKDLFGDEGQSIEELKSPWCCLSFSVIFAELLSTNVPITPQMSPPEARRGQSVERRASRQLSFPFGKAVLATVMCYELIFILAGTWVQG
jgi:hypothetical protein